jgi:hypothetical protein
MAVAYGVVRVLARTGVVSFPKPGTGDPTPAADPVPA